MSATILCRRAARATLLAAAVMLAAPAFAGDRPATPEGAHTLQAFFDRLLPAPPAGSQPLVSVKPDGQSYRVSADLAAMNGLVESAGADVSYESATLVYRLFEQDDGKWRIVQDSLPRIVSHARDATSVLEVTNARQTVVIDPALAWFVGGDAGAEKGRLAVQAPRFEETFEFGPVNAAYGAIVNADGTVSSTIKETIADVAFRASTTDKDGKAVGSSGRMDKVAFNVGVDGLKSRKLFDFLALLSAHRADLRPHEAELKDLLRPLAAPGLRFVEGAEASKLMVSSPLGAVALDRAKLAVAMSNVGPDSAIDANIGAEGLSLPVGLAPASAAALTPSKIDLVFTVKGIDLAAAANRAIDGLHFGDSGPTLSDADWAKTSAALMEPGPLKLVLAPSHVVAPALDSDVQGELRYAAGKTSGAVTLKLRGFEKTVNAIKALGPEMAARTLPLALMARGLARTDADGGLRWLIELGEDRSIKVNGLPLGKAPE